jgi:NADH-quinone oxidoreductase subunit A
VSASPGEEPREAMANYWPFFLFFVLATVFAFALLAVISFIRYRAHDYGDKLSPYECGVDPATPTARESYSIRFYLLTLVFIVFEAETFLLFPWAVVHDRLKIFGLIEVLVFLAILGLGYVYAWKAEALDFRRDIE